MRKRPTLKQSGGVKRRYRPYGAARELFLDPEFSKDHPRYEELKAQGLGFICGTEILLEGPAGTGKTYAVLRLVNLLMNMYPGIRVLFTRETRASMTETVLVTWEEEVLGPNHACLKRGGERANRNKYVFENGSEAIVVGMNNWQRIMSSEYDLMIYFEVVDEQDENRWAAMQSRLRHQRVPNPRGYADRYGVLYPEAFKIKLKKKIPSHVRTIWDLKRLEWFGQGKPLEGARWPDGTDVFWHLSIGDCNPGPPQHWANRRADRMSETTGKPMMRRLKSLHKDNPTCTADYLDRLRNLPAEMKDRLYHGLWTAAEGAIYKSYRPEVHIVDPDDRRQFSHYVGGIDWGYNDAGVFQVWGINQTGMYRVMEVYWTQQIPEWWENIIVDAAEKYNMPRIMADPSRPGAIDAMNRRLRASRAKTQVFKADNSVLEGIDAVQYGLDPGMGEKPKIYLVRDAFPLGVDPELARQERPLCLEDEISAYSWRQWVPGMKYREEPKPGQADHACDTMRYVAMDVMRPGYLDTVTVGHTSDEPWVVRYNKQLVRKARSTKRGRARKTYDSPY